MIRKLALAAALAATTLAFPATAFAHDHDGWHGGGYDGGWRHAGYGYGYGWHGGYGGSCIKWSYTFDRWVNVCD